MILIDDINWICAYTGGGVAGRLERRDLVGDLCVSGVFGVVSGFGPGGNGCLGGCGGVYRPSCGKGCCLLVLPALAQSS